MILGALLLVACGDSRPSAPERQPAGELVFTSEQGHQRAYEITDGALVADLGTGLFVSLLNGGGDIAEAYTVAPEPEGIRRVQPGRPFQFTRIAAGAPAGSGPGSFGAALVPAPGLTSFVGQRNVLMVLMPDSTLIGYQAGREIWRRSASPYSQLGGNGVLFDRQNQTAAVAPESGAISVLSTDPNCAPLAEIGGQRTSYCRQPSGGRVLIGNRSFSLPASTGQGSRVSTLRPVNRDEQYLYFESGDLCRVTDQVNCRRKAPLRGATALSPEGAVLYSIDGKTILEQSLKEGLGSYKLNSDTVYTGLATSRDGTFVYALGAGSLDVFTSGPGGKRVRRYPALGFAIVIVAGG